MTSHYARAYTYPKGLYSKIIRFISSLTSNRNEINLSHSRARIISPHTCKCLNGDFIKRDGTAGTVYTGLCPIHRPVKSNG